MKILAAIKRVPDSNIPARLNADSNDIETTNIKMTMNPFDEIAVEEAVRLKEKGLATEIVVISIGTQAAQETLRTALAMGADRGILLETTTAIQPYAAAKLLHAMTQIEKPKLVMLGKQAIDSDNNQTGQMLAGLLDWPQGTFISSIDIVSDKVLIKREIDGGIESLELTLPAVITTDLRLNEPRYLSLPNIVQAKRKPIQIVSATDLVSNITSNIKIKKMHAPEKQRAGVMLNSVSELVYKLKNELQVIR